MEDLGTLDRLGLESLYYSCIPIIFFSGLFTAWRAAEKFYAEGFDSSSITHCVLSLCLHLSFFNLCHLISTVDVLLFGLDCLSILY